MRENKETVERYIDGFNKTDHQQILSCLTDDVEWVSPGLYHHQGKVAFDKEIENENFKGSPKITINRLTEEKDVVIAEGSVEGMRADDTPFKLVFCDVFEMQGSKIRKLTSYLMFLDQ